MTLRETYLAIGLSPRVVDRLLAEYDASQRDRAYADGLAAVRAMEEATRLRLDPRSEQVGAAP